MLFNSFSTCGMQVLFRLMGTSPLISAGVILLEVIASSSIAIVLSIIFKSQSLINVIIFFATFFFGFIGGSNNELIGVLKSNSTYNINTLSWGW